MTTSLCDCVRAINPLGRLLYAQLALESWICYSRMYKLEREEEPEELVLHRRRRSRQKVVFEIGKAGVLPDTSVYQQWPRSLL